jgi:hypothetical protein
VNFSTKEKYLSLYIFGEDWFWNLPEGRVARVLSDH